MEQVPRTPEDETIHSPPIRSLAREIPVAERAAGGWHRTVWQASKALLIFFLVLWNGFVLLYSFQRQENDFDPMFHSAIAFARGNSMYGLNQARHLEFPDGSVFVLWNLNPPHLHLLVLPLIFLPRSAAMLIWLVAGFASMAVTLLWIDREAELRLTKAERPLVVIAVLGFAGTASVIFTAHISLFLFLIVTLGWIAARRGRWGRAGIYLGLGMAVKPFLLFLVPTWS